MSSSPASTPRRSPDALHVFSSDGLNGLEQRQQEGQTRAGHVGTPDVREESDRDSDGEGDDRRKPMPGGRGGAGGSHASRPVSSAASKPPPHLMSQLHMKTASPAPRGSPALSGSNQYFILKSINHENIARAVAEGIWATQRHNEGKLNSAFRSADNVILIFSVNMSGHFQGYARMTTLVGGARGRPDGWLGNAAVGTIFGIEWRRVLDLPFSLTESLINPLNEGKPVRIARDGQELPTDLGKKMVDLFEGRAKEKGVARPVPPPRPPAGSPVGGPPRPPPRPPGFRPGMGNGMGGMPMGGSDALVFNEMGVPVGNLSSFGLGGGAGGGMMNGGGLGGGMGGMQQGGMMGGGMRMMGGGMMGVSLGLPTVSHGMGGLGGGMGGNMGMPGGTGMGGLGGGMGMGGFGGGMGRGLGAGGMALGMGMGMGPSLADSGPTHLGDLRRSPHRSRDRRTRSRSRSGSPRRRSRRSRSRSRDRGRSSSRAGASKPNLMEMSYDEYLAHFERVRRQRANSNPAAGHSDSTQMGGAASLSGTNAVMGGGGNSIMAGGAAAAGQGQVMMSEDAYIAHCQQFAAQKGQPLNIEQVRQFYRQTRVQMMGH